MRQQQSSSDNQPLLHSESQSNYTNETSEARKERMDKKRAIRKGKAVSTLNQKDERSKKYGQEQGLTREQKALLQKQKNREAAQKSRDQHKLYVQNLETENKRLLEQLAKPKFCPNCNCLLQADSGSSTEESSASYAEKQLPLPSNFFDEPNSREIEANHMDKDFDLNLNGQSEPGFLDLNFPIEEPEQESAPFVRVNSSTQGLDHTPFKMLFFVAMIILGLALSNFGGIQTGGTATTSVSRDLMEVKEEFEEDSFSLSEQNQFDIFDSEHVVGESLTNGRELQTIKRFDLMNQMENSLNMNDADYESSAADLTELAPLSAFSQPSCIKSIINGDYIARNVEHMTLSNENFSQYSTASAPGVSSSSNVKGIEVFSAAKASEDNILFCSLPKLYRRNGENHMVNRAPSQEGNLFTKMIDIILSGAEVIEIMGEESNFWMNKVINFEGLYKVNAEIRGVVKLEDPNNNCIL